MGQGPELLYFCPMRMNTWNWSFSLPSWLRILWLENPHVSPVCLDKRAQHGPACVSCACMYNSGHRRYGDSHNTKFQWQSPLSNRMSRLQLWWLPTAMKPSMQWRQRTHQDPQGEQAWTLKTRSLFCSLLFWCSRSMLPGGGYLSLSLSRKSWGSATHAHATLSIHAMPARCMDDKRFALVVKMGHWGINRVHLSSWVPAGSEKGTSTVCIHSLLLALHNPISALRNLPSILLLSCLCERLFFSQSIYPH